MGIASRLRRRETLNIPIVREYESPGQTEARLAVILCRNYREDKRTGERVRLQGSEERVGRKGGSEKGSQSWRKVAELISGHEWEAVFPENNARGPRGVGFQENADCFPGSHAPFPFVPILHPPIPLLLFLLTSPPPPHVPPTPRAINLRLRQRRRRITRPLRMRACV